MPVGRAEIMCLVTWCWKDVASARKHNVDDIRSVTEPRRRMKKIRQA